ncbi:hypothetical protein BLNAU_18489 [Blattamonas nauphoetae]|uniref:Uncharacterized protein n=1 Tax=Blattamonas nauphoetae TaxID=2049346 RepID=A0ABQ9X468_9EUKA|nr:hypothetical protein BLNAU_18489 [Blattamonas nauphoetae]
MTELHIQQSNTTWGHKRLYSVVLDKERQIEQLINLMTTKSGCNILSDPYLLDILFNFVMTSELDPKKINDFTEFSAEYYQFHVSEVVPIEMEVLYRYLTDYIDLSKETSRRNKFQLSDPPRHKDLRKIRNPLFFLFATINPEIRRLVLHPKTLLTKDDFCSSQLLRRIERRFRIQKMRSVPREIISSTSSIRQLQKAKESFDFEKSLRKKRKSRKKGPTLMVLPLSSDEHSDDSSIFDFAKSDTEFTAVSMSETEVKSQPSKSSNQNSPRPKKKSPTITKSKEKAETVDRQQDGSDDEMTDSSDEDSLERYFLSPGAQKEKSEKHESKHKNGPEIETKDAHKRKKRKETIETVPISEELFALVFGPKLGKELFHLCDPLRIREYKEVEEYWSGRQNRSSLDLSSEAEAVLLAWLDGRKEQEGTWLNAEEGILLGRAVNLTVGRVEKWMRTHRKSNASLSGRRAKISPRHKNPRVSAFLAELNGKQRKKAKGEEKRKGIEKDTAHLAQPLSTPFVAPRPLPPESELEAALLVGNEESVELARICNFWETEPISVEMTKHVFGETIGGAIFGIADLLTRTETNRRVDVSDLVMGASLDEEHCLKRDLLEIWHLLLSMGREGGIGVEGSIVLHRLTETTKEEMELWMRNRGEMDTTKETPIVSSKNRMSGREKTSEAQNDVEVGEGEDERQGVRVRVKVEGNQIRTSLMESPPLSEFRLVFGEELGLSLFRHHGKRLTQVGSTEDRNTLLGSFSEEYRMWDFSIDLLRKWKEGRKNEMGRVSKDEVQMLSLLTYEPRWAVKRWIDAEMRKETDEDDDSRLGELSPRVVLNTLDKNQPDETGSIDLSSTIGEIDDSKQSPNRIDLTAEQKASDVDSITMIGRKRDRKTSQNQQLPHNFNLPAEHIPNRSEDVDENDESGPDSVCGEVKGDNENERGEKRERDPNKILPLPPPTIISSLITNATPHTVDPTADLNSHLVFSIDSLTPIFGTSLSTKLIDLHTQPTQDDSRPPTHNSNEILSVWYSERPKSLSPLVGVSEMEILCGLTGETFLGIQTWIENRLVGEKEAEEKTRRAEGNEEAQTKKELAAKKKREHTGVVRARKIAEMEEEEVTMKETKWKKAETKEQTDPKGKKKKKKVVIERDDSEDEAIKPSTKEIHEVEAHDQGTLKDEIELSEESSPQGTPSPQPISTVEVKQPSKEGWTELEVTESSETRSSVIEQGQVEFDESETERQSEEMEAKENQIVERGEKRERNPNKILPLPPPTTISSSLPPNQANFIEPNPRDISKGTGEEEEMSESQSNCYGSDINHFKRCPSDDSTVVHPPKRILTSIELRVPNNLFHSSLVASSPSPRECMISEMSISDCCVTTRNPLFGSHFEVLSIIHCAFQNISQPSDGESVEFRKKEGQQSLIVGSSISKSENGLYGLLMRDTNDHHQLTSLNCTFVDNIRTFTPVYVNAAPIENKSFTSRQISTANDVAFKKCTFTSCSASGENGGAMYHYNKGSLAVEGCSFTSCSAYKGTAIFAHFPTYSSDVQIFTLNNCRFDRCGTDSGSRTVYIFTNTSDNVFGTFSLQTSNFTNMKVNTRAGFDISALGSGIVQGCRFDNLTVATMQSIGKFDGANGKALSLFSLFSEKWRFTESSSLTVTNLSPDDNPVVSDCWFEALDKDTVTDLLVDAFPGLDHTSATNIWSASNPDSVLWGNTLAYSVRQTPDIVIDAVEGLDEEFCWMREKGCRTMSETINDRTSSKFEGTFLLASDSHSDSGVVVGQRKLVMKPQLETKATISDEGSSAVLFSISTGNLALSSVDFSPHIESSLFVLSGDGELKVTDSVIDGSSLGETELSKPLFKVKGGTTTLTSLILLSMTSSVGLIAATSGSDFTLVISKSTFSALTRRVGSGVVVEGRMGSASTVSISESKFTECHTLDEDYVEHDDPTNPGAEPNRVQTRGGSLVFTGPSINAGTVELSSSNFSDCSCANSSGASINVHRITRLSITSCLFENQFASGYRTQGATVSGWHISDATVQASFFKSCRLSDDSVLALGGAITFQESQSQTDLCQFEDCSASYAAHAIHLANSDFSNEVTNCVFDRCVGEGVRVIHTSNVAITRFLNCSFIGCCDSKADTTTVVGVNGLSTQTLEISKCYVVPDFSMNKKGVVRLTGIYETNPAQATITECGFLSASPHLLPSTIQKDGIGFATLRVSKGEVGGEKEGEDSVMCGHPDRKCLTLRHAATLCRATEGTEDMISVIVGEGEHSEETIAVGGMRIGVRGEDGKKRETMLRSQDGTRLMTLGDGLLSQLPHHRHPIDLVLIIKHLEQWNALDHICVVLGEREPAGSATLDSCDLPALLFSNKEAFITVASEGTLLLKSLSCDFEDASSDSLISSSGSVELVDCSLSNIALASSLLRGSGALSLGGCTFTCLLDSAHSEDSSHVVDVTIGEGKSLRIGKSTSNSKTSFVSCSSKEDGGGLKVCVSGSGVVELAEVHFSKCSSSGNGGAVLIEVASLFAGTISFASVEFGTGDNKNTATLGTDLFVTAADLSTLVKTAGFMTLRPNLPLAGTFGKEEKNGLMGKDGNKAVESLLFIWYPHRSGDKHVEGATGEDHVNCGLLQLPCLSLSTTHRSLNETNQTISIDSSLTLADSITARSTGSVLTSTLSTPPTLTIASAFSFVVSAGPIELSSLSFVPKEEARSTPLFSISDCGSLSVRSCSFSSFKSTSSPSILFGSVGSDQCVTLDSITFTSCRSSGQVSSGVISLSLSADAKLSIKGSTTITTCSSPTADSDFLFLSRPTFTKSFVSSALSLSWDKDDTTTRSFVGKEGSHTPNVPLYLFFAELGSEGHLSNVSSDTSVCGFAVYPCASLSKMIARLSSDVSPTIQLDSDFTQSTSQSFSFALTIEGNDRKLIIADPSTEFISSGFFAVSSSVALNAVVVEISSLKHVDLFSILSGKLKMEGCTILLKEGTISGSVVKVEDGGSLVVNGSVFTDIVSSDSKGGVIVGVVSESSEFRIDNTTFSNCKCEGIAHCIWMELRNSSTNTFSYSMTNIGIERTKKETKTEWNEEVEESKKATDVFVMGSRLDDLIDASDWEGSFTEETNAESLWGDDGVSGVHCSLLVYLIEISEAVEVDSNGETFTKCGHFLLFCSSMELGVNRLIGTDLEKIRVMESISMDIVVSLEGDITICGSTKDSTLLFTPDGQFVNELHNDIASSLSIDSLIISFPTTAPSNPLFVSSCGTLSFASCSITSSIPITRNVISIEGGILRVTGMSATDLEMTDCAQIESKKKCGTVIQHV